MQTCVSAVCGEVGLNVVEATSDLRALESILHSLGSSYRQSSAILNLHLNFRG